MQQNLKFNWKENMIQIDAKSIENMLVTSVIVFFDNDIERLTKNLKKREIKETLSSFHSK